MFECERRLPPSRNIYKERDRNIIYGNAPVVWSSQDILLHTFDFFVVVIEAMCLPTRERVLRSDSIVQLKKGGGEHKTKKQRIFVFQIEK